MAKTVSTKNLKDCPLCGKADALYLFVGNDGHSRITCTRCEYDTFERLTIQATENWWNEVFGRKEEW
mgnify:CR=1 FL=1